MSVATPDAKKNYAELKMTGYGYFTILPDRNGDICKNV